MKRIETIAVHAGGEPDAETGAIAPPIHLTTTFQHGPAAERRAGFEQALSSHGQLSPESLEHPVQNERIRHSDQQPVTGNLQTAAATEPAVGGVAAVRTGAGPVGRGSHRRRLPRGAAVRIKCTGVMGMELPDNRPGACPDG